MTKRVILMRHAKSSWKSDAPTDHERPLNKRGRRDAPRVGAELARLGWVPETVLSSDSSRTVETFARMKASLGFEGAPIYTPDLYHAGIEEIRDAVRALPKSVTTALLLGHNPGWEDALTRLSGCEEPMKTGCTALLQCQSESWSEAIDAERDWTVTSVIRPRELNRARRSSPSRPRR